VIDLLEEYFKRDLSAAEEAELAKLLAASPEAALKMAEGMSALYRQGGQDEPRWPERPLPATLWKRSGPWIKLGFYLLLNLGLIALVVYLLSLFPKIHTALPAGPVTVEYAPLTEDHPLTRPRKTTAPPKAPFAPQPPNAQSALPNLPAPAPPVLPNLPIIGRQFEQLSVVVDNPQEGLATVKIYDQGHTLIRRLFTGILPAGKQTLTWDGQTDQGGTAPSGTYSLEVQSGDKVIRSEVHIQGDAKP
jgi:hypothetical protein